MQRDGKFIEAGLPIHFSTQKMPFSIRLQLRDVRLTNLQNTWELMGMSIRINETWSLSYPCWLAIKMHWPCVMCFLRWYEDVGFLLCLLIRFIKWGMTFIAYLLWVCPLYLTKTPYTNRKSIILLWPVFHLHLFLSDSSLEIFADCLKMLHSVCV